MSYTCLDLRDLLKEFQELDERDQDADGEPLDEDEKARLAALKKLDEQLSNDFEDAADNEPTLINRDGWVDYCRELADDLGYVSNLKDNPLANHIDWDGWAEAVEQDYEEVEFDGETYLHRRY